MQDGLLSLMNGKRGHFKLESGYHGELWLDLDTLFLRPAKLQPFIKELTRLFTQHNIDGVCGPLTGGAFIATIMADILDCEFYFTERKTHPEKNSLFTVEYTLPENLLSHVKGKRIALVDDVISAGSATKGSYASLKKAGADIVVIGSLIVLGDRINNFVAEEKLALETLEHQSSNTWLPEECPLCASHVPLEDFVS